LTAVGVPERSDELLDLERGVEEVEQVRRGRPEPSDAERAEPLDGCEELFLRVAADACVEEAAERPLVLWRLVDVGDVQLGLPQLHAWSAPFKSCRCSAIECTTVSIDEPRYALPNAPASISRTTACSPRRIDRTVLTRSSHKNSRSGMCPPGRHASG